MARGPYKTTPELQTLSALLFFAQDSRWPALAAITHAAHRLAPGVSQAFRDMTPEDVAEMKASLLQLFRVLAGAEEVVSIGPFSPTFRVLRIRGEGAKKKRKWTVDTVELQVNGTPRDVAVYLAASLLEKVGTDRLRACKAADCDRLFIRSGKREYCSARCARRDFLSAYDPYAAVPRRKDKPTWYGKKGQSHGKKTRTR